MFLTCFVVVQPCLLSNSSFLILIANSLGISGGLPLLDLSFRPSISFSRRIFVIYVTFSKQESTKLYKRESNPKIKERLLLVLKVEGDGILPAHAADELHRSRSCLVLA
jgi:hypothetical protein